MATYKKRGGKPVSKKVETALETESVTEEVFNTLDSTASKSEQWIEKNNKPLFYGLIAIAVLILGFLAYNNMIIEPRENEATNELAFPRKYFNEASASSGEVADSLLTLALKGTDGKYGFIDIVDIYNGTNAGNVANYYAGVSYLQLKEYDKAISYLSKYNSDDELLAPIDLAAIGDAFADINQPKDALEYYESAAYKRNNEFTTPLFLFKAGQMALELNKFSKAESLFKEIKESFPKSDQGKDIEKYINIAKYAQL